MGYYKLSFLYVLQFSAAIAGAWTLQGHTLQKISLFDDRHIPALASSEEETETKVAREGEEALLYLGKKFCIHLLLIIKPMCHANRCPSCAKQTNDFFNI